MAPALVLALAVAGPVVAQDLPSGGVQGLPSTPGLPSLPTTPEAQRQPIGGAGGGLGGGIVLSSVTADVPNASVESTLKFSPSDTEPLDPYSSLGTSGGYTAGPRRSPTQSTVESGRASMLGPGLGLSSPSALSSTQISGREASGTSSWKVSGFDSRPGAFTNSASPGGSANYQPYSRTSSLTGPSRVTASQMPSFGRPRAAVPQSLMGTQFGQQGPRRTSTGQDQYGASAQGRSTSFPEAGDVLPGMDVGDGSEGMETEPESSIQTPGLGYQPYLAPRAGSHRPAMGAGDADRPSSSRSRGPGSRDPRGRLDSNDRESRWERLHPSAQRLRQKRDRRSRNRSGLYR